MSTPTFRMNRLNALPRGFGAFPVLEVLDLTYNNLNEESFPANFFILGKTSANSQAEPLIIVSCSNGYLMV